MSAVLSFVAPPPGFEPELAFVLAEIADSVGLYSLTVSDDATRRVFVLDAAIYLPEYTPSLSVEQSEALALTSGDDARVFVVANPAESGTTVNLLAPIVVNSLNNAAAQFILDDRDWPVQAPLGA